MIKKVLLVLTIGILCLVGFIATRPNDFLITRSSTYNASADAIFAQINDLHNWNQWSPWAKLDPNAQAIFEGMPSGVGAQFHWIGNNKVGEGKMTIIESRANEYVKYRLEFIKPFAATNTAEFIIVPVGENTTLTWSMSGKNNFIGKAMSVFMNCDKMVGGQFEQGLSNLRAIVEKK